MTISFQNPGLIDLNAITTFGVNVKEAASPIGYFGTGFKYAVAIILRNGGEISIWRGKKKFEFSAKEEEIRGEKFKTIFMNATRLGFTTELGKNWEPWQAFRELESNARDEGGKSAANRAEPLPNTTTIWVDKFSAFEEAFHAISTIFAPNKPLFASKDVEVHAPKGFIFYRGIRVGTTRTDALYGYNLLAQQPLTEDRTLKDNFMAQWHVAKFFAEDAEDSGLLETCLSAPLNTFEGGLNFEILTACTPSQPFARTVAQLLESKKPINHTAVKLVEKQKGYSSSLIEVPLTAIQEKQLLKAIEFLSMVFDFDKNRYPIKVVNSIYGRNLGCATEGKIYIAKEAFSLGTKIVAGTVLEEYLHLNHDFRDESREFQDYLLNLCVSLGEQLSGDPL